MPAIARSPGQRRSLTRAAAIVFSFAAALASSACGRSGRVDEPVLRLTGELEASTSAGAPAACAVGGEERPALGCVPEREVLRRDVPGDASGDLSFDVTLPPELRSSRQILDPELLGPLLEPFGRGRAVDLPRGTKSGRVTFAIASAGSDGGAPEDRAPRTLHARVGSVSVPPAEQRFITRALRVGSGAALEVGLGFDGTLTRAGASPVEFLVAAESEGQRRELAREVLDPAAIAEWTDRRIPLDWLAGREVRLFLSSRVVPRPGEDVANAFAGPLWGSPMIVEPTRKQRQPNIVLVSLDTLRGDALGGELAGRRLMPELERIAQRGTVFEDAMSTFSSTTASHMSLFTSLYPVVHGVVWPTNVLDPSEPTLPEILAAHGYATSAVTEDGMLFAPAGFARGFDSYREFKGSNVMDTRGFIEQTFAAGIRWLERHPREKFFLFLHTYQVHEPYTPPPEHDLFQRRNPPDGDAQVDAGPPPWERDRALYAGEVHFTDAMVRHLIDELDRLGLTSETIVVITSDHGEEFHEHGGRSHARTVYQEVLHVPLVLIAPGTVPAGLRVATPVSLIDLAPTLIALSGIEPPPGFQGRSLAGLLRGDPFPADRLLFAENGPLASPNRLIAARRDGIKWIFEGDRAVPREAYDLGVDPDERAPIADSQVVQAGRALFEVHRAMRDDAARRRAERAVSAASHLDEETVQKLRALGYVP